MKQAIAEKRESRHNRSHATEEAEGTSQDGHQQRRLPSNAGRGASGKTAHNQCSHSGVCL